MRCSLLINHSKVHASVRWFVYFKLMSHIPATYQHLTLLEAAHGYLTDFKKQIYVNTKALGDCTARLRVKTPLMNERS